MKNSLLRGAFVAALAVALSSLSGPAFAGDLKMSMQNGRVTIIADNVPLRQILQEWARIGQTTIVNADKMTGPAISLQLVDAPEREALDILLRSASGYIAAPRPVPLANAAFYDRVTIMATSHAPAVTAGQMVPPTFQRPPAPIDDSDEPINVMPPQPQGNPVVGGQYPGMQPGQAQPGAPVTPLTSPKPGAVQQQPQQPMPNGPYQPIRPPLVPGPAGRGGGPGGQ
jgi:hypothetical protein